MLSFHSSEEHSHVGYYKDISKFTWGTKLYLLQGMHSVIDAESSLEPPTGRKGYLNI